MTLKPPHIALALAALLALPLAAAETKEKASTPAAAPATGAAMKIYVDPATGQIVPKPIPTDAKALAAATPQAPLPALKVEKGTTKAGGRRVRLDDRFMMEMTATTTPDGKISYSCKEEGAKGVAPAREDRHDR